MVENADGLRLTLVSPLNGEIANVNEKARPVIRRRRNCRLMNHSASSQSRGGVH